MRARTLVVGLVLALLTPTAAATQAHPEAVERQSRGFWGTVVHTVGGALIGGWMGYVGSQITVGDWAKSSNGELMDQRRSWVAGGMVAGALGSLLIGPTAPPDIRRDLQPVPADRNKLTREELERAGGATVYDVVSRERPRWLEPRGSTRWAESARGEVSETGGSVTPGETTIWVYLDGVRLGGVETLKEISPMELERAEFVEPAQAAIRYGAGHVHGVIALERRSGF